MQYAKPWIFLLLCLLLPVSPPLWADDPTPPAVGQPAPDFALPDQHGDSHKLRDYRGQWVVLYFYPKDDTPGCTTEACRFRDDIRQLRALGAQVLGVSVDSVSSHADFAKQHGLPFPLLADEAGAVAERYDALFDLLVTRLAKRKTFLIDPAGVIAKIYAEVDPDNHSEQVIEDLKQLQLPAHTAL